MADFYLRAARVLDLHSIQNTSLKSLVKSNSKDDSDAKRLLKLSISTLEYLEILKQLIKVTSIQTLESKAFGERDKRSSSNDANLKKRKEKEQSAGDDREDETSKIKSSTKEINTAPSSTSLLLVLLHDLLFSPKNQISSSSTWPPKLALERHKARLKAELVKIQIKKGAQRLVDLKSGGQERKIAEKIPRWIRINEGKISTEKCLELLGKSGWKLEENENHGAVAKDRLFYQTPHLPNLLCFHPSQTSRLLSHHLFKSGSIIMQDLASCFPAHVLIGDEAESGSHSLREADRFVDATSAPGNKTSHLSALVEMRLRGKNGERRENHAKKCIARVSAFEHSPQRYKTLCKLLSKAGCLCEESEQKYQASIKGKGKMKSSQFQNSQGDTKRSKDGNDGRLGDESEIREGSRNVKPILSDFLATDPLSEEWKDVSHMLLDPSCSGSGIVGRMDYLQEGSREDGPSSENDNAEEIVEGSSQTQLRSRLEKLGEFQLKMIKHAMKFSSLRRLTYSTCSIHAEENEHVVLKALESEESRSQVHLNSSSTGKRFGPWRIASRSEVIPTWETRGIPKECNGNRILADSLLRSIPGGDSEKHDLDNLGEGEAHREACNGFFLALFVRDEIAAENRAGEGKRKWEKLEDEKGEATEEEDENELAKMEDPSSKKTRLNRKKKEAKKRRKKASKESGEGERE